MKIMEDDPFTQSTDTTFTSRSIKHHIKLIRGFLSSYLYIDPFIGFRRKNYIIIYNEYTIYVQLKNLQGKVGVE